MNSRNSATCSSGCHIGFVGCNDLRPLCEILGEVRKLLIYLFEIVSGVSALNAGYVDHVYDKTAALHMAQERVSETYALARTLDKARDIRHYE